MVNFFGVEESPDAVPHVLPPSVLTCIPVTIFGNISVKVIISPIALPATVETLKVRPVDIVYLTGLLASPEAVAQVLPPSVLTCIPVTLFAVIAVIFAL